MTVSFESLPSNIRVPLFYAEMDNSKANTAQTSGASLLIGQALADAAIERNKLVIMPSADQARKMCGQGSQLARMVEAYRKTDPFGELYVIAVSNPTIGASAIGKVEISGEATAAGNVSLYVGSKRVQAAVAADDDALEVAQTLAAAINADADLPFTAAAEVVNDVVPVTGVTIKDGETTVDVDGSITLEAVIAPATATNKAVSWETSDAAVLAKGGATESQQTFTGVADGVATVTVTTSDGGFTDSVEITVGAGEGEGGGQRKQNAPVANSPKAGFKAEASGARVTLTAKHNGSAMNGYPLTLNYYGAVGGEEIPDGLTVTITAVSGGSGSVDFATAIAAMGDEAFDYIGFPFNDSNSIMLMVDEMDDTTGRWSWSRMLYGHAYTAMIGSLTDLVAFGDSFNAQHITICGYEEGTQSPVDELIASRLGRQAAFLRNDPARPTQTGEISGALPAPVGSRFSITERQSLLTHGIATATVNSGTLQIERDITTYKKNKFGVADNSYLDSETLHTSAYVIRRLKTAITSKYPRHKLANDGTRFGPGQAIVTPSVLKGEMCACYREMELAGIVENFDVFKNYLIVERNADDPNRVDVLFPPDYVNQLRVFGLVNQFRQHYSTEEINGNG